MLSPFRHSILQRTQEIWDAQPVFLDTETTGLEKSAEIIEICIIDHDGQTLLDTLVKPRRPIPPVATLLHGITDEMVSSARSWLHIWPQVDDILRGRLVGIYNAEFDLRMMQQSHLANGMPWRTTGFRVFDIMKMFSDYSGTQRWMKLEQVGRLCKIALPNSHRAYADTLLARSVFDHIRRDCAARFSV